MTDGGVQVVHLKENLRLYPNLLKTELVCKMTFDDPMVPSLDGVMRFDTLAEITAEHKADTQKLSAAQLAKKFSPLRIESYKPLIDFEAPD